MNFKIIRVTCDPPPSFLYPPRLSLTPHPLSTVPSLPIFDTIPLSYNPPHSPYYTVYTPHNLHVLIICIFRSVSLHKLIICHWTFLIFCKVLAIFIFICFTEFPNEANRSMGSWAIIGHTNKQTEITNL